MGVMSGLFVIIVLGIAADTIVKIFKARSGGAELAKLRGEVRELTRQLHEHHAGLTDAHAALSSQEAQLQEVHERLDFAERILAQQRQPPGLGAGPAAGG